MSNGWDAARVTKSQRRSKANWPAVILAALLIVVQTYDLDVDHEPLIEQCSDGETAPAGGEFPTP